ncbi:MAG: hypothetical protein DWB42_12655 [Chloroflexi bacterium]|nr:hypothetical protein [Chloroflexota bacterium]
MGSHFAIFLIFYVARHIGDTLSAVDQIAQQVHTVFRVEFVMDGFGVADFLAAVKKVLRNERLMLAWKPLYLARPRTSSVRMTLIWLILHKPQIRPILEHVAYHLRREQLSGFSAIATLI